MCKGDWQINEIMKRKHIFSSQNTFVENKGKWNNANKRKLKRMTDYLKWWRLSFFFFQQMDQNGNIKNQKLRKKRMKARVDGCQQQ